MCIIGKKLLILGGTSASLNLVKLAESMGVYTVVVDETDVSKRVANRKLTRILKLAQPILMA